MKKILIVFIVFSVGLLFSCQEDRQIKPEISKMKLDINIIRFDSIFASAGPQDLKRLKTDYPFMFKNSIPDSLWQIKLKDTLQNEIEQEVLTAFPDFSDYQNEITLFFKHLKYYFPKQSIPKVVTLAEYVDYKSKVVLGDDILYISLDNYLGEDHKFYKGLQQYISALQKPSQILPDIAHQYANRMIDFPNSRTFLSQMIFEGKKLYFKSRVLPWIEDHRLVGYLAKDFRWATEQEYMVWQYFIERDMLYSSKTDLNRRFLQDAPFSKFYLEIDNETPPRLGAYIGWQIVKAYAEKHPNKSLKAILELPEQELFNQSKYKP
ncbi:gliding motility lipoprotein GldB [Mesohalobacter halotolerans]|uniref:Gliding motility lipoprotein GldB n=1 Tax=Mesohalobacter halotolerans TaxID=1883405 RepID=A0A4U5TPQ0_9FLAO|nr:gliding motility lipoprotein GldB [Mesohalobacter halotolerans]MBS3738079.1 gliding motility lipoprotein GldB [Psychroflexus sp.]TKS56109.1 gliding motility lipoprotein GldB [Mesohalobacter halotolerans]